MNECTVVYLFFPVSQYFSKSMYICLIVCQDKGVLVPEFHKMHKCKKIQGYTARKKIKAIEV